MHRALLSEQRLQPQPSKPSEASLIARGLALVYDPTLVAETKQRQPKPDQALRIASSPFNADMSDMRCAAALLPPASQSVLRIASRASELSMNPLAIP